MRTRLEALSLVVLLGLSAPALAWSGALDNGVQTKASQSKLLPEGALKLLKEGNKRFLAGKLENQDRYRKQVSATASVQFPFAAILSCLDSSVGVEQVFDLKTGDAFVGRVAGDVFNPDMLGSLEFATRLAGSKVMVVLGQTQCGAVKGACDHAVGEANVRLARDSVVKESPVIKELVDAGKVIIVGAVYDLESGVVRFLDS